MNPMTQPGVHPDAESLNAFAEQALAAAEREQVLTHLASCGRCREVVFLAQQAAGAEADAPVAVALPEPDRPWQRWFAGWRWTWIPATALAGVMGFAVLHHFQNVPTEMEVARNTPQEVANSASTNAAPVSKPGSPGPAERNQPVEKEAGSPASARSKDLGAIAKKAPESANSPAAFSDKNEPAGEMESVAVSPSVPVQAQPNRGEAAPAQKAAGVGGPRVTSQASQQQLAGQQQEVAQDQLHSARYSAKVAGVAGGAMPAANAARADAQSQAAPTAPPPPAAREPALQAEAKSSGAFDRVEVDSKKKVVTVLPNGTNALSVATAQGRTVAIDPDGAMFLNETPGGQWIPVAAQWTGRAVLVRAGQTSSRDETTPQPAIFELVNDKSGTWVSSDGRTWTAEPPSTQ
jgi:Putative zinc-finger